MPNINYQVLMESLNNKDIQKHLDYLTQKYKDKKFLLYGSGLLAEYIFSNYDLSKLNIIGIADNKYKEKKEDFNNIKTYSPEEMHELDFDVLIIFINDFLKIKLFIKQNQSFKRNINFEHALPHNFYEKIKYLILETFNISGISNSI